MKRSYILIIRIALIAIVTLIILGYGLFQARDFIKGPDIFISTPQNGDEISKPVILVAGGTININNISLNDRPIFIDKLGNFSEKLQLSVGYNIIKLVAQDKFGRTKIKLIELTYTPASKIGTSTQIFIQ